MDIQDQYGNPINTEVYEKEEQVIAERLIEEDDVVLELGARYGSVSCVINKKLNCKTNQVVVEPDDRVWSALERNKKVNDCGFNIVKGFISSKSLGLAVVISDHGYGTTTIHEPSDIPFYSLDFIRHKYNLTFNVLVADCEGYLEEFLDENPELLDTLRLIHFEADCPHKCDYKKIRNTLEDKGFLEYLRGFQNVWLKIT
jgi:FkbM family methyltransferase